MRRMTLMAPLSARPGGLSLESLRRVGSPNTHEMSGEHPMLRIPNPASVNAGRLPDPDCAALGCEWDEGSAPCTCGQPHAFRLCARCLTPDTSQSERCPHTTDDQDGDQR